MLCPSPYLNIILYIILSIYKNGKLPYMDESSYNYRLALFVCCTLHVCLEKTDKLSIFCIVCTLWGICEQIEIYKTEKTRMKQRDK